MNLRMRIKGLLLMVAGVMIVIVPLIWGFYHYRDAGITQNLLIIAVGSAGLILTGFGLHKIIESWI